MVTLMQLEENRQAFRNALALLSAGVSIITTNGPAGRSGLTASAICSVTDTPPTVLGCVNRRCTAHEMLKANRRLCINILQGGQQTLAEHFAGLTKVPMESRFDWPNWDEGLDGVPILRDALVHLQGKVVDIKDVGTHSVFFVELDAINIQVANDCLVYFSRQFHRLAIP